MIRVSLKLGGMVAGANAEQLDALDAYGHRLGLAFQVTDDLLDVARQRGGRRQAGRQGRRAGKAYVSGRAWY